MKAKLYSSDGTPKGEISLPSLFETKIREDITAKYFESEKIKQPYSPDERAGRKHSAAGTISHKRHDWKGHYGRGISRIPRKTMWRRGTQFFWIGAEISGTRGGRRAHPPKGIGKEKKINKKEIQIAMNSAFASTASAELIMRRYSSLEKINSAPVVIESLPPKTKELMNSLKKILGSAFNLALRKKSVRPGKARGRKYKSNAGLLVVTGSEEQAKSKGVEIKRANELSISDLYPLGRLAIYTKQALEDLSKKTKEEKK